MNTSLMTMSSSSGRWSSRTRASVTSRRITPKPSMKWSFVLSVKVLKLDPVPELGIGHRLLNSFALSSLVSSRFLRTKSPSCT